MISTSSVIGSLSQNLQSFSKLADKISDPTTSADAGDIVALKQAGVQSEVSAAALKSVLDTQRSVDIIA